MSCWKNLVGITTLAVISGPFPAAASEPTREYVVSTVAGGVTPVTRGPARGAAIGSITGLTADLRGNVYLSTDLNCVFRIDSARILTRIAGTGRPGYSGDGGPAVNAQLRRPAGMTVDSKGALYIADYDNQVVRKVLLDGTITTIAGDGRLETKGDGGPAIKASLTNPHALATDGSGNVYIAESNGIRRVSPDGTITNLLGNGVPGISADGRNRIKTQVVIPGDLAVDSKGNLCFSVPYALRLITPSGEITTIAGTGELGYWGDGGQATDARLAGSRFALDREGNFYIADSGNFRIRKVSPDGAIITVAGNGNQGSTGDGGRAIDSSVMPEHLAVDSHGTVYVADFRVAGHGWSLRNIARSGTISTLAESAPADSGGRARAASSRLYWNGEIALDAVGNLYVAEADDARIRKVDRRGRITTVAGGGTCCDLGDGGPATNASIGNHFRFAVDAKGNLYIAGLERVRKVSSRGIITTIAGTGTPGFAGDGGPAQKAQLNAPGAMALDSVGNLYIADQLNRRVRKVATDGTISTVAGSGAIGRFRDGDPAVKAPLETVDRLAVDSAGDLFIGDSGSIRKVSPVGIISTVPIRSPIPGVKPIFAVDEAGVLYVTTPSGALTGSTIARVDEMGGLEPIAGNREWGYSGDGGPGLKARFAGVGAIAIDHAGRIYLSDTWAHAVRMLTPVRTPVENTSDLKVELRSATGSNRFQTGEEIPLEVAFSSGTANRYLQPCALFRESNFGFPQCRFFNRWSFSILSGSGWVDLLQEFPSGPVMGGGMMFEVPNPDLSTTPATFSYFLTHRFRFDVPGEYRVRLAVDVGLDDETTQRRSTPDPTIRPRKVVVTRDIVLQIVPAAPEWQSEIIRKGVDAMSWIHQLHASQPSREDIQRNQEAANALCNLGTPNAARALARLLLGNAPNYQQEQGCLQHTASPRSAIEEMERLLTDPDTAVTPAFFQVLVRLLGAEQFGADGPPFLSPVHLDAEREKLFDALPRKQDNARVSSLLTILENPLHTKGNAYESGYTVPFAPAVIGTVVANFDRFPKTSQEWLMDDGWDGVRSPLMLPVVRQMAAAGDGHALLRWLELDPPAAMEFMLQEVVRPAPRFSSFYIRLPEPSLPSQENQIASNFIKLTEPGELTRAATLLHRYATVAVLPVVLPFTDAKRATWPCSVQIPVLAYLFKVSPGDAESRSEQLLSEVNDGACRASTLFTDLGILEPGPVLDRMALAEIDKGPKSLLLDATTYLRQHGSAAMKPLLRERLVKWQQRYVDSGAEQRSKAGAATNEDNALRTLVEALADSYARAQAWLLSSDESASLGTEMASRISCTYRCGALLGSDGASGRYAIYGRVNEKVERKPSPMEYLNPSERLHYTINQFRCDNMKALKAKLLQFPVGSTFDFAWDFTAADRDEVTEIGAFLRTHGYRVGHTHDWSFLTPDPVR